MRHRGAWWAAALLTLGLLAVWWGRPARVTDAGRGAGDPASSSPVPPTAGSTSGASSAGLFQDVSATSGIGAIQHVRDGRMDDMLESVGAGAVALDYDGDGRLDVYLLRDGENRLYHNEGGMRFTDVTARAGVSHAGRAFSGAAGDVDGDGDVDLFVFNHGPNVLYRNRGDGTFEDVTASAGIAGSSCSVAGTLLDVDGDGHLDLYVGNYLTFDDDYRLHYGPDAFPGPLAFDAEADVLYRGRGDGTFEDVTARTGLDVLPGRAMGVVATDFDDDGHVDVFVANDASANFLLRGSGGLHFSEVGMEAGVAYGFHGEATGAMAGVVGDVDLDGHPDLHVTDTHYGSLYLGMGGGRFRDDVSQSGIAAVSGQWVSWGGGFLDFDNDGDLDLLLVDGDLHHPTGRPDLLFENEGACRFANVSARGGPHFHRELLGRAGLLADFDNDGRTDALLTTIEGPPVLLRNGCPDARHWITLVLEPGAGHLALGARVTVRAGGRTWVRTQHTASGYLTQNDPRLHFGLGAADRIDAVEVRWPDGKTTRYPGLGVDRVHTLRPDRGGS